MRGYRAIWFQHFGEFLPPNHSRKALSLLDVCPGRSPPIHPNEKLAAPVTRELQNTFRATMFKPLAELFKEEIKFVNAKKRVAKKRIKTLVDALKSGKVKYQEGRFTGEISARLIRELADLGATKVGRAYFLPPGKMTQELRSTVESLTKARAFLYEGMNKVLTAAEVTTPAAIATLVLNPP